MYMGEVEKRKYKERVRTSIVHQVGFYCFKMFRASLICSFASECTRNSAATVYPAFVSTVMKNRARSYMVVLKVTSNKVIVFLYSASIFLLPLSLINTEKCLFKLLCITKCFWITGCW